MPIATTEDQRAASAAVRSWAAKAVPNQTSRDQESTPDAWRKHWPELAGLGILSVAIPAELGGAGATVGDLAVMLEAAADALTPGPLLPSALAGLLLARSNTPAAASLAELVGNGSLPAAVAFAPADPKRRPIARRNDAGDLIVTGTLSPVLGVDADSLVILPARLDDADVWLAVSGSTSGFGVAELNSTDFSRALGAIELNDVIVAADHQLTGIDTALVDDLAATLFSAEASGVASWALRTAVDYAKVREQFGAPIGSFQAIKHLCAEMLCRVEQCSAVAWDAAVAADGGETDQLPLAAAVAAAVALDAAVQTAKDCIQVLGGIGFTWEHEAHLYLRRALVLRQLLGGTRRWRERVGQLSLDGARRELHIDLGPGAAEQRAAVRSTVAEIATVAPSERRAALAKAGYLAPHWPHPYGLSADAALQLVIDQELAHAQVSRPDLVIAGWAVPTILQAGTDAQKQQFVAPTLNGDITWCQLFSEPGAGSDLASLRTRATRVDGGWRLDGQKVWTSVARSADWGICLARTDPDAPKHKGISYFLIDMRSAGIDIRPLREITGEALFNEVFLDSVFVPDELVVGEVNDGWRLARATLVNERIAMAGGAGIDDELGRVLELAQRLGVTDDPAVRDLLGGLVAVGLSGSLLDVRSTLRQLDGQDAGAESSVRKLIGVRYRQAVADAGLELLGADGAIASDQAHAVLMTRCLTIAGGTTQVLLTLAAERILGLPRG